MKKSLLVLLLLGLSATAGAQVFIYNTTQSNTEFQYDGNSWTQSIVKYTMYSVVEPNGSDTNLVNIWNVQFGTEKDAEGHKYKYYKVEANDVSFDPIKAQIARKTVMWILSEDNDTQHNLLTGKASPTKIGSEKPTIPTKLTGYSKWDETDTGVRYIGSGTISMTLNSRMTTADYSKSGEDAVNDITVYLAFSNGYEPEH